MVLDLQQSTLEALADFLTSQPSLEDLANYKASEATNDRVASLLEKNREDGLSPSEREEMQQYLTVSNLMVMVKAMAKQKLADQK